MSNKKPTSTGPSEPMMAEHLRASRGMKINKITVDIAERDVEEGGRKLDIIVYLPPGCDIPRVERAMEKMAREVFGSPSKHFSAGFRDPQKMAEKRGTQPLEVEAGNKKGVFKSFELSIHPPRSAMYTVEGLEERVLPALNKALNVDPGH